MVARFSGNLVSDVPNATPAGYSQPIIATSTRPRAAKLPISMPLADLMPAPVVGGGDPGRVPLDVPLVGLAVAVALAYVQPEKFTKTLSFGLAALEQSHEKVAVVVLAVPLPGAESVGKAVMVAVELVMEAVPELEPEPEAE